MKSNRTTVILLLLLGIALAAAYILLPKSDNTDTGAEQAAIGAKAISTLNELQAVQLDFSVLTDPAFNYLKNIAAPDLNLPVGRSNPFAPVK